VIFKEIFKVLRIRQKCYVPIITTTNSICLQGCLLLQKQQYTCTVLFLSLAQSFNMLLFSAQGAVVLVINYAYHHELHVNEGITPCILNTSNKCRWFVSFKPSFFTPSKKSLQYWLIMQLNRPRASGEGKDPCPAGNWNMSSSVQPSHYRDWPMPASVLCTDNIKKLIKFQPIPA